MPKQLEVELGGVKVQNLVDRIEEGTVVLPDFQRDFVWPTHQVGKLMESLLNGYYINTLLVLPALQSKEHSPPFPPRKVDGAPDGDIPYNVEMVLDGQQRITSIYYALTAPRIPLDNTTYPQLFYLRFSKVVEGRLDEDAIDWRRRDWDSSQRLIENDYQLQIEEDKIPFTVFKNADTFRRWRRGMERFAEKESFVQKAQIDKFEDNTQVFQNYKIPIIKLSHSTPERKVVRTFERINTQGLELGVFDILTARLWTEDIRLRDLWEDSISAYPQIDGYADETGEERLRELLLKTLALARGDECKDASLRELSPAGFEDDWALATKMMDRTIEKAKSSSAGGFGVTDKFGFPYTTMLPPLANLIYLAENEGAYPDHAALDKVQQWYWISVFSKRYSGSSDTMSYRDFNEMKAWMKDGDKTPDAITNGRQRISAELDLETLTRGGLYKGIMSLLALNGAKDFGTLESIDVHKVDDHHIFPKACLQKGLTGKTYDDKTERNKILNRTIIQFRSNRYKYKDKLPSEYVPEMVDEHPDGEKGVRDLLQDHFVNEAGFEALLADDYEAFCSARKEAIQEAIEDRIGRSVPWSQPEQASLA